MSRDLLLKKTIEDLAKLPDHKLMEASDFVDFLVSRIEDNELKKGIHTLASTSDSFSFLSEDEAIYTKLDLKENYK
jgi:hypothetical protein